MADYIKREDALALKHWDGVGLTCWASVNVEDIEKIPTADVVEVVPELRKAVELLRKEYEKAKQNPIVRDPLAYALYQAWRAADGRRNGR